MNVLRHYFSFLFTTFAIAHNNYCDDALIAHKMKNIHVSDEENLFSYERCHMGREASKDKDCQEDEGF